MNIKECVQKRVLLALFDVTKGFDRINITEVHSFVKRVKVRVGGVKSMIFKLGVKTASFDNLRGLKVYFNRIIKDNDNYGHFIIVSDLVS